MTTTTNKQRHQVHIFANTILLYPATKIALIIGKQGIIGFVRTYIQQLRLEICVVNVSEHKLLELAENPFFQLQR